MKYLIALFTLAASPAIAQAEVSFFNLRNLDFATILGFAIFISLLLYLKVPGKIAGLLDKRADDIRNDLNEARALREEAQTILASYERKQKEVQEQADRIVAHAKEEASIAAKQANLDLEASIERRLTAAKDQISSAEAAALREVRDSAIQVAIAAASDVIAKNMSAANGNKLIEAAIKDAEAKLH